MAMEINQLLYFIRDTHMKVTITASNKSELELNREKLESVKKLFKGNVTVFLEKEGKSKKVKLSSLSGLVSIGGDSIKDSDVIYE